VSRLPDDLLSIGENRRPLIRKGRWVGSGLSAGAYKLWPEIVRELCRACAVPPFDTNEEPTVSVLVVLLQTELDKAHLTSAQTGTTL